MKIITLYLVLLISLFLFYFIVGGFAYINFLGICALYKLTKEKRRMFFQSIPKNILLPYIFYRNLYRLINEEEEQI
jgi:hypothetical protein